MHLMISDLPDKKQAFCERLIILLPVFSLFVNDKFFNN